MHEAVHEVREAADEPLRLPHQLRLVHHVLREGVERRQEVLIHHLQTCCGAYDTRMTVSTRVRGRNVWQVKSKGLARRKIVLIDRLHTCYGNPRVGVSTRLWTKRFTSPK